MNQGELDNAKRRALNLFDQWNNVTGFVIEHTSYYYELQGIIEDAVECGAQGALRIYKPLESEEPPNAQVVHDPSQGDPEENRGTGTGKEEEQKLEEFPDEEIGKGTYHY